MDVLRTVRLRDKDGIERYELTQRGGTLTIRAIGVHFPRPLPVPLEELEEGVRALRVGRDEQSLADTEADLTEQPRP